MDLARKQFEEKAAAATSGKAKLGGEATAEEVAMKAKSAKASIMAKAKAKAEARA